ncbi:MAG: prenyltransferase [bacterium]
MSKKHITDIEAILAKRHQNGGDYWASVDGRIGVGTPFSTLESPLILHELQVARTHEAVKGALQQILDTWRDDGRFRVAPRGAIYPCHTANAIRVLCRFGMSKDRKLQRTFDHLFEIQHNDGGWRCKKFSGGRGPETEFSNPGVTIFVLDAFRFTEHLNKNPALDRAVESLLDHWMVKRPIGPCHFGIGTLFMQVEYPFLRYNLFYYVYVLSFYNYAKEDKRFLEALSALDSKLDEGGRIVVERPHRSLAQLSFCKKGEPSELATRRYEEIKQNVPL